MTEQPKWTPGPWEYRTGGEFDGETAPPHIVKRDTDSEGRKRTAFVATCGSTTLPNQANARLIAAAPEEDAALLKWVEWAEQARSRNPEAWAELVEEIAGRPPMEESRTALAKARGEA